MEPAQICVINLMNTSMNMIEISVCTLVLQGKCLIMMVTVLQLVLFLLQLSLEITKNTVSSSVMKVGIYTIMELVVINIASLLISTEMSSFGNFVIGLVIALQLNSSIGMKDAELLALLP